MNYLHARTTLLQKNPRVSFTMIAVEAAALVGLAALMVLCFA